jgi:Domain of unknown function (DUF4188)
MSFVFRGRHTAQIDGPFVVFIIGMRINKLWAIHKWLPVARAMGPMVEHLLAHPEIGLMHAQAYAYWRGAALVQYWQSFEQLERFARDPSLTHLDAWKRFNKAVGADGSVGIWHESYVVQTGQYECVYANMPRMGLACAGKHLPVVGARETAKGRLGLEA